MSAKLQFGLIGAGRIGKLHANNITHLIPDAQIKIVADILGDSIKDWANSLEIPRVTADYREVINDPEIGAALICSSTDTHADLIVAAARAGKHIFCEKPVDLSVAKIKTALQAVEEAGVKLQIGFNRRFDHNHRSVKEAILAGKVGEPQLIQITSRDPAPPPLEYIKVSGGLFLDMTIHDFDMARFLAGSEVTAVYAAGGVLVDPAIGAAGDIDTAIITLKFANGALGVINNSRQAAYGYDQRVEVFGSKGSVMDLNDTPSTAILSTAAGIVGEKPQYFFLERYNESFMNEMKAFVAAVLSDQATPVGGNDGLQSVLIAHAAQQSLTENRPIKIADVR
jgi:myo-inositol 2-dehydrogenase/D-chiro-inositol 1-dehydrogenase